MDITDSELGIIPIKYDILLPHWFKRLEGRNLNFNTSWGHTIFCDLSKQKKSLEWEGRGRENRKKGCGLLFVSSNEEGPKHTGPVVLYIKFALNSLFLLPFPTLSSPF